MVLLTLKTSNTTINLREKTSIRNLTTVAHKIVNSFRLVERVDGWKLFFVWGRTNLEGLSSCARAVVPNGINLLYLVDA